MELIKSGRILSCVGGLYTVRIKDGDSFKDIQCRARGAFRHSNMTPLVGDIALVDFSEGEGNAIISDIKERKNSLIRPPLANLDCVFVTMAASFPQPALDLVDKLTAILEFNDIEPIIIVGKCELDRENADRIKKIYESAGYRVFILSCKLDEGIDCIRELVNNSLNGKIAAFAGASGVGKSTLMNKLFPTLELGTGDLSRKIERGKHTTRAVTLYQIGDDAYLADTPGFGLIDFVRFDFFELENLAACFGEFYDYIGECKYTKCTHKKEEGCKIVEAVRRGDISPSRHESYCAIYDEFKTRKRK